MREILRLEGRWKLALLLVFILYCFPVRIFGHSPNEERPLVIKEVRIFDGFKLIPQASLLVEGNRIKYLGQNILIPEGAEVIEGRGKTLLPGLIDSHVHVISIQMLEQAPVFGVTAVVDMFMDVNLMKSIKKRQSEGQARNMAHLISAGILATAPSGHGTEYGLEIPTLKGPEEAQAFVRDRLSEGSDFIKIIYDSGESYFKPWPTLDLPTIKALIDEAHRNKKLVVVHASTLKKCLEVLNLGADGLAHLYFDDSFSKNFARQVARRKAFIIPTLTVLESFAGIYRASSLIEDVYLSPYLRPQDLTSLQSRVSTEISEEKREHLSRLRQRVVRQLKENGVPLLAGTDVPNPGTAMGASLHHELELLVLAGLKPLEALRAATSVPAEKFGLTNRGKIKPGYYADLVLVEGNPAEDIKATRKIVMVWKEGMKIDREKYKETVSREKEMVEKLKQTPAPDTGSGLISDFESGKPNSNFGAGWMISADSLAGGKSRASMAIVEDGAEGSHNSLRVTGEVLGGGSMAWAGVMFFPGSGIMRPANLSAFPGISFFFRGTERTYAVVIFTQRSGFVPAHSRLFKADERWKEYHFTFSELGLEPYDVTGIFIGAFQDNGSFWFQLDNVRLK